MKNNLTPSEQISAYIITQAEKDSLIMTNSHKLQKELDITNDEIKQANKHNIKILFNNKIYICDHRHTIHGWKYIINEVIKSPHLDF